MIINTDLSWEYLYAEEGVPSGHDKDEIAVVAGTKVIEIRGNDELSHLVLAETILGVEDFTVEIEHLTPENSVDVIRLMELS